MAPSGIFYHALNRGNARNELFHNPEDYSAFERVMTEAMGDFRGEVAPPPISKEMKKRWSYFIRKVYETDPLACPKCQGDLSAVAQAPLRRVKFKDPQSGKSLVFLTNNFALPTLTITQLYRLRWRIELFFKWIKQHLRIQAFFGTPDLLANFTSSQYFGQRDFSATI
jgi:hypothetical protein